MWKSCAIVNSFSKSDAVAGLRIGYIYGTETLVQFCSKVNADTIMNPPTFPALAIVLTCLFRCLYINSKTLDSKFMKKYFINLFRKLFYVTTAVVPSKLREYADNIFNNLDVYYQEYISEQLQNELIMHHNYENTLNIFSPYIKNVSAWNSGFNFCIQFRYSFCTDEISLIKNLIDNTGVAILTESSFSLKNVKNNNFFIRFSTACEENAYHSALIRMVDYLESEGFQT